MAIGEGVYVCRFGLVSGKYPLIFLSIPYLASFSYVAAYPSNASVADRPKTWNSALMVFNLPFPKPRTMRENLVNTTGSSSYGKMSRLVRM